MTVTVYRSTDGGAPALNGTAGSFVAVLDFCLVASGWTIAFTSGNLRSYQEGAGNGFYLGVDDSAGQTARVRGFETMTAAGVAVVSGTGPFPTDGQQSGGLYQYKSSNSGGAGSARDWIVIATDKQFYFWCNSSNTTNDVNDAGVRSMSMSFAESSFETENPQCQMMFFGDAISYLTTATDNFNTMIIADTTSAGNQYLFANLINVTGGVIAPLATSLSGHFVTRSYTQLGGSIVSGKYDFYSVGPQSKLSERSGFGNSEIVMRVPNFVNGRVYLSPVWTTETAAVVTRGELPGIIAVKHGHLVQNAQAPLTGFADVLDVSNLATASLLGREYFALPLGFVNGGTNPDNWIVPLAYIGTNDTAWTTLA